MKRQEDRAVANPSGQLSGGVGPEIVDSRRRPRQQLHIGHDFFVGVDGAADNSGLRDRRMRGQDGFDLGGAPRPVFETASHVVSGEREFP